MQSGRESIKSVPLSGFMTKMLVEKASACMVVGVITDTLALKPGEMAVPGFTI
jgi:hypothetical protein